jgi:putative DNA primase/helicase
LAHGDGSNGKSTLLALLLAIFADYGCKAPEQLLTSKKFTSHPTEIAKLFGKRLVVANETEDGAQLSEARVKDLTGGDRLTARRMNEDFWDFDPVHKIIIGTNHKPKVNGTGHAIWRRLRLVPFLRRFWREEKHESGPPDLKADPHLTEKLKAEYPGILAWLVAGCLEWQASGLSIPPEVQEATQRYREHEDKLAGFIAACCELQPDATASVAAVLDAYCEHTGENEMSNEKLSRLLTDRGFVKRRATAGESRGLYLWHCIGLT